MKEHYSVIVIGTGFGGSITALSIANAIKNSPNTTKLKDILMLERGTWWTTPVGTVQDKEVKTYSFLKDKQQPVQFWPSLNTFRGALDIFTRCFRRGNNVDGLYEITSLGPKGLLGLLKGKNDGVSIVRACGVGGGSLVYSNITIRPPELIFDQPEWKESMSWDLNERNLYYELARHSIGYGVLSALAAKADNNIPYLDKNNSKVLPPNSVNAGLNNINTRSARLDPHWIIENDSYNSRGRKKINVNQASPDAGNALWIDRARVFQTAISKTFPQNSDWGSVDLAINDITPENTELSQTKPPSNYPLTNSVNYCERQGRCNVGCLPGARHTLNKQLMTAAIGSFKTPNVDPPFKGILEIAPLAEVDYIEALPDKSGYKIYFYQYEEQKSGNPGGKKRMSVTAEKVIVSAGCYGTNKIMLKSKRKGLKLSSKTGYGFSTNGDSIYFLENTKEHITLTRGPVTTSYGHFNTINNGSSETEGRFHTIEDQGIPPALASLIGYGIPLIKSLAKGRNKWLFILWTLIRWALNRTGQFIKSFFQNYLERQDIFRSDAEITGKMMCVVSMGRAEAKGAFRLGGLGDTSLRINIKEFDENGNLVPNRKIKRFSQDSVYSDISTTLDKLASEIAENKDEKFINPVRSEESAFLKLDVIPVVHPLGGCCIAKDITKGVVDEFGRVFYESADNSKKYYEGLYVADASVIPTALGVNPSLTISALSLRIANRIIQDSK